MSRLLGCCACRLYGSCVLSLHTAAAHQQNHSQTENVGTIIVLRLKRETHYQRPQRTKEEEDTWMSGYRHETYTASTRTLGPVCVQQQIRHSTCSAHAPCVSLSEQVALSSWSRSLPDATHRCRIGFAMRCDGGILCELYDVRRHQMLVV